MYVRETSPSSGNSGTVDPASEQQLGRSAVPTNLPTQQSSYGSSSSKPPPYAPKPAWVQNSAVSSGRPSAGFESESVAGRRSGKCSKDSCVSLVCLSSSNHVHVKYRYKIGFRP